MQTKVTTMGANESRVNKEESGKSEDRYSLPDYSVDWNVHKRGSYGHADNQMRLTIYWER